MARSTHASHSTTGRVVYLQVGRALRSKGSRKRCEAATASYPIRTWTLPGDASDSGHSAFSAQPVANNTAISWINPGDLVHQPGGLWG